MKVLLIHTYLSFNKGEYIQPLSEPLGLLYIATYLQNNSHGIDVKILDLYALGFARGEQEFDQKIIQGIHDQDEISSLIRKENPEIIGIHCNFTGYFKDTLRVAEIAKNSAPNSALILGGAHASEDAINILNKHSEIDYIVRKEGEVTFCELSKCLKENLPIDNLKGIALRDKTGTAQINIDRPFLDDLDISINRELIDMPQYLHINKFSFPLALNFPVATIFSSRGCPYDCIFCSTKNMWSRKWRVRSPEHVVEEIDDLVYNYGVKEIAIYDDQWILKKEWVHEICDLIISRPYTISLTLPAGTSVWLAGKELLAKMKKAGFYRLCFPIESGSPDTNKFIQKPVKLDEAKKMIKVANNLGYYTVANFIIGFPYEKKKHIKETIDYAYNCGVDWPFFFIARPFAGAEMYDIYQNEGLLHDVDNNVSGGVFVSNNDTKYFKSKELEKIRLNAEENYLRFKLKWLLNPKNFLTQILPKIKTYNGLKYSFKIIKLFIMGAQSRSPAGV